MKDVPTLHKPNNLHDFSDFSKNATAFFEINPMLDGI